MKNHGLRAAALALAVLAAAPCAAQAGWRSRMHWRGGSWLMHAGDAGAGSLPAGAGANWVTFDPSTRTLYVPNFFDDTITVVSADRGAPVATIPTGKGPGALALDPRTRTLYGVNLDDGTVSAYDAGACNARVVTACGGARATASVGGVPIGLAVDEATDTVYVTGDGADTMALLDGATCGRAGCAVVAHVPTGPVALPFADPATRTIYVPGAGDDADQVLVVDARTCNARATSGCGGPFPKATVGHGGATGGVDPSTRTVYVANADENTVSVIDGARCNGSVSSGCGDAAPATKVGPEPNSGVAIDPGTHTMYVISGAQDVLSVVDTGHCRASDSSGCDRAWPTVRTGGEPFWSALDPRTHTVYTADFADDAVAVIDGSACNARRHDGCRRLAPVVASGAGAGNLALDHPLHTLYATDDGEHRLQMLDSARCTVGSCPARVEPVPGVSGPANIAVDEGTQTIYITNQDQQTVALLDAGTCNVSRSGGCAPVGPPIAIGGRPIGIAVDPRSHAVYLTDVDNSRLLRIDGAHCRIGDRSGCTPLSGAVGEAPVAVALDRGTGTVFTANVSGTVSVVDARRCCAAVAAMPVGDRPQALVFDAGTRTLYSANFGLDDAQGTVSVLDTRACNARVTSGCGRAPATLASGRAPVAIALDAQTHTLYTADIFHASVSILDGATCNALRTDGCARSPREAETSFFPHAVLFDGRTLYVTSAFDQSIQAVAGRSGP